MRIAVVGNGGAGKSVIAGTLARLLARRGRKVLAVDWDPNPGLAWSLGMEATDAGLPDDVVCEQAGTVYGWGLRPGIDSATVAERFALHAPDGVRYLSQGKIAGTEPLVRRSLGALALAVARTDASWDLVADLEAGLTKPSEGYAAVARRVLVVVTPAWKSALAARRIVGLLPDQAKTVVASQFDGQADHPDLPRPGVRIPFDPAVAGAERRGLAPLDAVGDSPAISAIENLAELLIREEP